MAFSIDGSTPMAARSVFVGTPAYDNLRPHWGMAVTKLQSALFKRGIDCEVDICPRMLLPHARNVLVERFLASDKSHLLFVDADMGFEPATVMKMIDADVDVVGVAGPKRGYRWDWICSAIRSGKRNMPIGAIGLTYAGFPLPEDGGHWPTAFARLKNGVCEVESVGTGLVLIARVVFERLAERGLAPVTRIAWDDRPGAPPHELAQFFRFSQNAETLEAVGEDVQFCRSWRSIGGAVHLLPDATIVHEGSHDYTGNLYAAVTACTDGGAR